MLAQAAERLANAVISQARLSFGTDVPELLSLSAQVCVAFGVNTDAYGVLCMPLTGRALRVRESACGCTPVRRR